MDADTSRLPDVMVMPAVSFQGNAKETAILQDAACLAVEIVSVSSVADDYLHKLAEYEAKGIPEYWIVNPPINFCMGACNLYLITYDV